MLKNKQHIFQNIANDIIDLFSDDVVEDVNINQNNDDVCITFKTQTVLMKFYNGEIRNVYLSKIFITESSKSIMIYINEYLINIKLPISDRESSYSYYDIKHYYYPISYNTAKLVYAIYLILYKHMFNTYPILSLTDYIKFSSYFYVNYHILSYYLYCKDNDCYNVMISLLEPYIKFSLSDKKHIYIYEISFFTKQFIKMTTYVNKSTIPVKVTKERIIEEVGKITYNSDKITIVITKPESIDDKFINFIKSKFYSLIQIK